MKIRKILSMLLGVVFLVNGMAFPAFAVGKAALNVEADKATVQAGEVITYTVYLCDSQNVPGGVWNYGFTVDIPQGLTYIDGSGKIDSGFENATGFASPGFGEDSLTSTAFGAFGAGYTGGKVAILSFQCMVNADAKGNLSVSLKDYIVTQSTDNGNISVIPNSVAASIKVAMEEEPSVDPQPPVDPEPVPPVDDPTHENCPSAKFTDVNQDLWYHDGIDYVIDNGLMNGVGDTLFAPNGTTNRAMIVTILHRLEGTPGGETASFQDVADGQWYSEAVGWAAANGIVTGYSADTFGPMNPITREQMAAILYRYAQYKGCDVSEAAGLEAFGDAGTVSSYAVPALEWAVGAELINGMDGNLNPKGTATRAQVATILMRFCENVAN